MSNLIVLFHEIFLYIGMVYGIFEEPIQAEYSGAMNLKLGTINHHSIQLK